ncbi:MAG: hypothetical protein J5755_06365, partial [Clostridia bacterium]|nr:hypothetical protein [Clostridia bacterium]
MSKPKPNKQTLSFYLSAAACLVAIAAGLSMMQMALTCGLAVGLGLSVFALICQALIAATASPYVKRKIRPMLWTTVGIVVLFVVSYIAVDLSHAPVVEAGKYVGMGIALLAWEVVCLVLAILLVVSCLLATLHKSNEPAAEEAPDAPAPVVDTDQLVAQAQDVVLRNKITVEEATPPQPVAATRRAVSPNEVREARAQAQEPLPEQVYQPAPQPVREEVLQPEEPMTWMVHEESRPVAEQPAPETPAAPEAEEWDGEEEQVIFAAQGAVDQESGAPLRDNDIRSEFVGHHTRQKPQEEDDDL